MLKAWSLVPKKPGSEAVPGWLRTTWAGRACWLHSRSSSHQRLATRPSSLLACWACVWGASWPSQVHAHPPMTVWMQLAGCSTSMQHLTALCCAGSMAALSLMTCISVAIGLAFKSMPEALQSTLPIGQYLGAATMLYFGVKTLRVQPAAEAAAKLDCHGTQSSCLHGQAFSASAGRHEPGNSSTACAKRNLLHVSSCTLSQASCELDCLLQGAWETPADGAGDELTSAQLSVESATSRADTSSSWCQQEYLPSVL